MAKKFKSLKYDNTERYAFVVTRDDSSTFDFVPSSEGLNYLDLSNSINRHRNLLGDQHTMVMILLMV